MADKEIVSNRRAFHDFEILERFEAGIVLKGTEIKSIREGGASLQDSYVKVLKGIPLLIASSIAPYTRGNIYNHEERRDRTLLLHKREIQRLEKAVKEKGLTLIALSLYFKQGRIKVGLAIAKGKKLVDKRASIKERDQKQQMQRALKQS